MTQWVKNQSDLYSEASSKRVKKYSTKFWCGQEMPPPSTTQRNFHFSKFLHRVGAFLICLTRASCKKLLILIASECWTFPIWLCFENATIIHEFNFIHSDWSETPTFWLRVESSRCLNNPQSYSSMLNWPPVLTIRKVQFLKTFHCHKSITNQPIFMKLAVLYWKDYWN